MWLFLPGLEFGLETSAGKQSSQMNAVNFSWIKGPISLLEICLKPAVLRVRCIDVYIMLKWKQMSQ